MNLVEYIINNKDYSKGTKLVKLYCIVMTNYRQELGDKSWKAITEHVFGGDEELTTSFSFLTGLITGYGGSLQGKVFEDILKDDVQALVAGK